jgi:methylamine--corrinoid protein Co-methyltransferase
VQIGLSRKEANRIVLKLVESYEKRYPEAPIGKTFSECYQMDAIRPTDEYESLYEKKKKEWKEIGFEVI